MIPTPEGVKEQPTVWSVWSLATRTRTLTVARTQSKEVMTQGHGKRGRILHPSLRPIHFLKEEKETWGCFRFGYECLLDWLLGVCLLLVVCSLVGVAVVSLLVCLVFLACDPPCAYCCSFYFVAVLEPKPKIFPVATTCWQLAGKNNSFWRVLFFETQFFFSETRKIMKKNCGNGKNTMQTEKILERTKIPGRSGKNPEIEKNTDWKWEESAASRFQTLHIFWYLVVKWSVCGICWNPMRIWITWLKRR